MFLLLPPFPGARSEAAKFGAVLLMGGDGLVLHLFSFPHLCFFLIFHGVFDYLRVHHTCWSGLVILGFESLAYVECKWDTLPDHQTTNPNHQLETTERKVGSLILTSLLEDLEGSWFLPFFLDPSAWFGLACRRQADSRRHSWQRRRATWRQGGNRRSTK